MAVTLEQAMALSIAKVGVNVQKVCDITRAYGVRRECCRINIGKDRSEVHCVIFLKTFLHHAMYQI
jgi:hypothetical protein